MDEQDGEVRGSSERPTEYEAPRVVRVVTPADFEQEVLYAGPFPY